MTYHARLITRVLFPSDTISFSFKSWKTTFNTQPQRAWGAGAVRRCENGMGGMTHNFYCPQSATVLHTIKLDVGSMINRTNLDPALQMLLKQRKAWFSFEITFDSRAITHTGQCHQGQNQPGTPDGFQMWVTTTCNTHTLQILLKNNAAFKQIAEMQDYSCLNTNSAGEIEALSAERGNDLAATNSKGAFKFSELHLCGMYFKRKKTYPQTMCFPSEAYWNSLETKGVVPKVLLPSGVGSQSLVHPGSKLRPVQIPNIHLVTGWKDSDSC